MTSPNFENIDLWLFDYTEGNLSTYQKELLEKYILNHPELEIDLDMWNMSKATVAQNYAPEIHFKKKKTPRIGYYSTSVIGAILILLISKSHELSVYKNSLNKNTQISYIQYFNENNTSQITDSNGPKILRIEETYTKAINALQDAPELIKEKVFDTKYEESSHTIATIDITPNAIESQIIRTCTMPIQLPGLVVNNTVIKGIQDKQEWSTQKKRFSLNGIRVNTKSLFNKIDRALSKSVAFSNYKDHFYMIPGIASNNVNLSTTGAISQSRFISTTRTRWLTTSNQKLSQELSFDTYVRALRSGLGAQINYDTYANGAIQDWNATLVFSPKIGLSRNISLEPAAKLKVGNKLLNANQIENNTVSLYHENSAQLYSFDSTQKIGRKLWYRELDAGFTFNTKVFYIGFQAENLLNHIENLYQNEQNNENRIATTYSAIAGTQYMSRNEKVSFHPYIYLRTNKTNTAYYGGFSFDLDKLFIGASYGSSDQYTGSIGVSFNQFALVLQTTRAFQPTLERNLFTHQMTLRINTPESKKTRRYITL